LLKVFLYIVYVPDLIYRWSKTYIVIGKRVNVLLID